MTTDTIQLGIVENLPAEEYHATPACSNSACKVIDEQSPGHWHYQFHHPKEPTEALIFGSAAHILILEGHVEFERQYLIAGRCTAIKKDKARCDHPGKVLVDGEWRCGIHAKDAPESTDSRRVLSQETFDNLRTVRDRVMSDPLAGKLLEQLKRPEMSAFWKDPQTGTLCKARWDAPLIEQRVLLDLKSIDDASKANIERSILAHHYDTQAAHYIDGAMELDCAFDVFGFIFFEKTEPFAVRSVELDKKWIDIGRARIRPLIDTYAKCAASRIWPLYENIKSEPPEWAVAKWLNN